MAVKPAVSAVEQDISMAKQDVSALEKNVPDIGKEVAAIEADMGTLQSDMEAVETDMGTLQGDVKAVEADIDAIEQGFTGIKKPTTQKPKTTLTRKKLNLLPTGKRTRKRALKPVGISRVVAADLVQIGTSPLEQRLATEQAQRRLKAPAYYQNNREIFVNFINGIFQPYKKQMDKANLEASCDTMQSGKFSLLAHQLLVRDYLNLFTPYRGLLLYHGLGSGKTCASVAIAEGMKENKKVIVMTPASLQRNYYEEIKKCGDVLYTKAQFWEFIPSTPENISTLSHVLQIPLEFIRTNTVNKTSGAWLVDVRKKPNFNTLNNEEKASLDKQLDIMIANKYRFISYNGLRKNKLSEMTQGGTINPFDDSVVVVDEAHNLVSMIVNKLGKDGEVASTMYELLQSAQRARIVLLSGNSNNKLPQRTSSYVQYLEGVYQNLEVHA